MVVYSAMILAFVCVGILQHRCASVDELKAGLEQARLARETVVLTIEVDRYEAVPGYDSWWDVPVAEVSSVDSVRAARAAYEEARGLS